MNKSADETKHDLRAVNPTAKTNSGRNLSWLLVTIAFLIFGGGFKQLSDFKHEQARLTNELSTLRHQLDSLKSNMEQMDAAAVQKEAQSPQPQKLNQRIFTQQIRLAHSGGEARSVSWADYDADGDLDVLLCSMVNRLYRNDKGSFAEVTAPSGLSGGTRCAAWADYDGDGDLDLFDSNGRLWTNMGGTFKDDSALLPKYPFSNNEGGGWLDANADDLPDILLSDGSAGLHLMLNRGTVENRFENADAAWNLGTGGIGVGNGDFLSIADFNTDGFPDFLYNLGRGILARNVGGKRFEALEGGVSYRSENPWKLGTCFGDFDNDGDLDLFVPQNGVPHLYLNAGEGVFANIINDTGDLAVRGVNARSAAWGDVNLDGKLDLLVGYPQGGAKLFLNSGNNVFLEAEDTGLQNFTPANGTTGMAFADYDDDGDLDLLLTAEQTHSAILVNTLKRPDGQSWLKVKLAATETPGALIQLFSDQQKLLATRQVGLVQTFSSQGPPEAVFGVKPGTYTVKVRTTDGKEHLSTTDVGPEGKIVQVQRQEDPKPEAAE